jgi:Regulator of chromosome condensation (RCC1) repeat
MDSLNKKRKADNPTPSRPRSNYDNNNLVTSGGGSMQQRRVQSRSLGQNQRRQAPTAFQNEMNGHFRSEYMFLDSKMKEMVANGLRHSNSEHAMIDCVCEYARLAETIDQRFGSTTGDVIVMGSNEQDRLGLGIDDPDQDRSPDDVEPTRLRGLPPIRQVVAGGMHSIVLSDTGVPYTFGQDDNGTLGRESVDELVSAVPRPVIGFVTARGEKEDGCIRQAVGGDGYCMYLSLHGNVYMNGSLKDMDSGVYCLPKDSTSTVLGYHDKPVHVYTIPEEIGMIYGGPNVCLALSEDSRTLYSWGESILYLDCLENYAKTVRRDPILSLISFFITAGFGNCGELARSEGMVRPDKHGNYEIGKAFLCGENGRPIESIAKEHFLTPKPVLYEGLAMKHTVRTTGFLHHCCILISFRKSANMEFLFC